MYYNLMFVHSLARWLVVISLVYSVYRAFRGFRKKSMFSKTDNAVRHWTATIAHVQLLIGIILFTQSPFIKTDAFFRIVHPFMMLTAIILITVGSAIAKRKATHADKFKTMLAWYSIALLLILIAIPWPFSPFANRPYFR